VFVCGYIWPDCNRKKRDNKREIGMVRIGEENKGEKHRSPSEDDRRTGVERGLCSQLGTMGTGGTVDPGLRNAPLVQFNLFHSHPSVTALVDSLLLYLPVSFFELVLSTHAQELVIYK
jgi:hypothetical protein